MVDIDWENTPFDDEDEWEAEDDEAVRTENTVPSYEAGIETLRENALIRDGISFSILFKMPDDTYMVAYRSRQPCYGEMRPYRKTHPEMMPEEQRNVGKPGDLCSPFPQEGNPVAVSFNLCELQPQFRKDEYVPLLEYILGAEGPYRKITETGEILKDGNGEIAGFLVHNMDVDPTLIVSLMMFTRNFFNPKLSSWPVVNETFKGMSFTTRVLLWITLNIQKDPYDYNTSKYIKGDFITGAGSDNYTLAISFDPEKFIKGNNDDLTGGTFSNRYAYNRPKLNSVFGTGSEISDILRGIMQGRNSGNRAAITDAQPLADYFERFAQQAA